MQSDGGAERDHLEHLPGRSFLLTVAAAAGAALVVSLSQLTSSIKGSDTALWGIVVVLATLSIIALAVAWEERRRHIHAVVRQVVDADPSDRSSVLRVATAELVRLGARREVEFLGSGQAD